MLGPAVYRVPLAGLVALVRLRRPAQLAASVLLSIPAFQRVNLRGLRRHFQRVVGFAPRPMLEVFRRRNRALPGSGPAAGP